QFNALVQRMDAHIADSSRLHVELQALIGKLDSRADKADLTMARLLTGLVIAIWAAQLLAPWLLHALGAPAS
ncbi:MAG TPA: hypothetical protein VFW92_11860, partial [Candidatus Limnocylindrales bacterium]|nr:hypothetical protein [Candidatus Limnocylindrales bacterium]